VHHLFDPAFADKFRKIVEGRYKRYGYFEYDTECEIERYKVRFSGALVACARMHHRSCQMSLLLILSLAGIGGKAAPFRY
jgi:hypothetical protein